MILRSALASHLSQKFQQAATHQSNGFILILIFLLFYKVDLSSHIWPLPMDLWESIKSKLKFFPFMGFYLSTRYNLVVLPWISSPLISQFPTHPIFPCQPLRVFVPGLAGSQWQQLPAPDGTLSGSNEGKTPASPANSTPSFSAIWHNICMMHTQDQVTVTRTAVGNDMQ